VPALLWVVIATDLVPGNAMHVAVGTSLAAIVMTSLASIRSHARLGNVDWSAFGGLLPGLVIGAVAGAPAQELFLVTGAVRLSDGGIAVANGGTHEVRVFDARGRHVRTIGGEGGGPGELRNPRRLFRLPDDSLEVVDFQTQLTDSFSAGGAYGQATANLVTDDGPRKLPTAFLSHGVLEALGIEPALGRRFLLQEAR